MKSNKRFLSLLLALLMVFGSLPAALGAAELPPVPLSAPRDYVQALSQLVDANWSDGFFSAMTLTAGEARFSVDGEVTAAAAAPVIEGGEVFLPREAVAQVRALPEEPVLQSTRPLMTMEEAQALGLAVQASRDTIMVTAPFQTRRLLVKTAGGPPGNTYGAAVTLPLADDRYALQYATETQAREACLRLGGDPDVLYAEPDGILSANAQFSEEAVPQALSWGTARIGAPAFQAILPASPPVIQVAVLDTGLDVNHPYLAGRISSTRWNFIANNGNVADTEGHGTHVSGTVVDASSPNVLVMPLKVMNDEGIGTDSLVTEGLRYAADRGAQVANLSLGSTSAAFNYWGEALAYAKGKGMTIVAASGNDGTAAKTYPAAFPDVIAVSASTSGNYFASYSNRGDWVDLGAPGSDIISTYPIGMAPGGLAMASGTSMATPHVSAAVALLLSYCPMPREDIRPYLISLCDNWANSGDTSAYGAGILNLAPRGPGAFLPAQLSMKEGETTRLVAASCPPVLGQSFAFASDNPAVAAVSPGGGVVALRPGTATVTATGPGGPVSVPVRVVDIDRIEVTDSTIGQVVSQPLQATATIDVHYADGSVNRGVTVNESNMSGYIQGQMGSQTITVNYKGHTAQLPIWVDDNRLLSLSISGLSGLRSYYPWEPIDFSNGRINILFSGLAAQTIPVTLAMCDPYDEYYPGNNQSINVRWNGIVAGTFSVYYSWTYYITTQSTLAKAPDRTFYPPLIPFSTQGGTAGVTHSELGTGTRVTLEFDLKDCILNTKYWSYTSSINTVPIARLGTVSPTTQAFGTIGSMLLSFQTPDPKFPITMATLPDKLTYNQGERIDPEGGMVRFTDWSGVTHDFPLQAAWCSWESSGAGTQNILVTVRNYPADNTSTDSRKWELTTSFQVQVTPVAPVTLTTLALLSPPAKTAYIAGEQLSTAGGKIRLGFSDGGAAELDLLPEHCGGFDPNRAGVQTVTVNLSGRTASFAVTVKARPASMSIASLPNKLTYRAHEYMNLSGGTVRLTYPDGSSETLAMTSPRIDAFQSSGGAPGVTGFDLVQIVCDNAVHADFAIVYVNAGGTLDGLSGRDTLIYKKDYVTFPGTDIPHVRWESSNSRVLTVNADGTINFAGRGSTAVSLVYEPPGRAKINLGKIDITVSYDLWQWLMVIFLFGWIWL